MPIQPSHDTRSILAPGGLHEDMLCVTLQAALILANVKQFIKHPYSISRATSIDSDWFLKATHQYRGSSWGGLKLVQLAWEPVSSCPKPCASPQKGRNLPVRSLYFGLASGFSRPTRVAPPTPRSRSESGAYSRAPPVLVPLPLKTVYSVDSTGRIPPSASGVPLMGHSTPGLLTVTSLPREAASVVCNIVPA